MGVFDGCFFKNVATAKRDAGLLIGIEPTADGKGYRIAKAKGEALEVILWDQLTPQQKEELKRAGLVIP
jgi:hypothetical protein